MSDTFLTQLVGRRDVVGKAKRFSAKMECNILSGVTYMVNDIPLIFEKFSDDYREMIFRTSRYLQDGIGSRRVIKAPLRNSEYPDISIKDLHGRTIKVEYSDKDVAVDKGNEFYVNEVVYQFIQDVEIDVVHGERLFRMDYMMGDDRIKLFPIMREHHNEVVLSLSDAFQMIKHGELIFVRKVIDENPFIKTSSKSPKIEFGKCYTIYTPEDSICATFKGFIGVNGLLFTVNSFNGIHVDSDETYYRLKATDIALGRCEVWSTMPNSTTTATLKLTVGCSSDSTYMVYDTYDCTMTDVITFEGKKETHERTTCTILYEVMT